MCSLCLVLAAGWSGNRLAPCRAVPRAAPPRSALPHEAVAAVSEDPDAVREGDWTQLATNLETAVYKVRELNAGLGPAAGFDALARFNELETASARRLERALLGDAAEPASSCRELAGTLLTSLEGLQSRVESQQAASAEESRRSEAALRDESDLRAAAEAALAQSESLLASSREELCECQAEAARQVGALGDALEASQDELARREAALSQAADEAAAARNREGAGPGFSLIFFSTFPQASAAVKAKEEALAAAAAAEAAAAASIAAAAEERMREREKLDRAVENAVGEAERSFFKQKAAQAARAAKETEAAREEAAAREAAAARAVPEQDAAPRAVDFGGGRRRVGGVGSKAPALPFGRGAGVSAFPEPP